MHRLLAIILYIQYASNRYASYMDYINSKLILYKRLKIESFFNYRKHTFVQNVNQRI